MVNGNSKKKEGNDRTWAVWRQNEGKAWEETKRKVPSVSLFRAVAQSQSSASRKTRELR